MTYSTSNINIPALPLNIPMQVDDSQMNSSAIRLKRKISEITAEILPKPSNQPLQNITNLTPNSANSKVLSISMAKPLEPLLDGPSEDYLWTIQEIMNETHSFDKDGLPIIAHRYRDYSANSHDPFKEFKVDHERTVVLNNWVIEVSKEAHFSREITYLAIDFIERAFRLGLDNPILGTMDVNNDQLLGMSALLAAAKIHQRRGFIGFTKFLSECTEGVYSKDLIIEFESKLLRALKWKLNPTTSFAWLKLHIIFMAKLLILKCQNIKDVSHPHYAIYKGLLKSCLNKKKFLQTMFTIDLLTYTSLNISCGSYVSAIAALYTTYAECPRTKLLIQSFTNFNPVEIKNLINLMNFLSASISPPDFKENASKELYFTQQHTPAAIKFIQKNWKQIIDIFNQPVGVDDKNKENRQPPEEKEAGDKISS